MSNSTRGQMNRGQIRESIESKLSKYCSPPDTLDRIADRIAYDYNLSPYTVRYTYLPMFITVGVLKSNGNGLYSTEKSDTEEKTVTESETPFTDYVNKNKKSKKEK